MMCGSDSRAASSDSRRNRAANEASAARWPGSRLTATVRLRTVSNARKTSPIPPRPISSSRRYGPNCSGVTRIAPSPLVCGWRSSCSRGESPSTTSSPLPARQPFALCLVLAAHQAEPAAGGQADPDGGQQDGAAEEEEHLALGQTEDGDG